MISMKFLKNLFVLFSCLFSSCGIISKEETIQINQNRIITEKASTIYEAIKDKDTKTLKESFCSKVIANHDLDSEIQKMFDFIDGEFISYEKVTDPGIGETIENGETSRLIGAPLIHNVKTSTNHEYDVLVEIVLVYNTDNSWEGVTEICVIDNQSIGVEKNRCIVGESLKY